jgi:hypothetical protein
MAAPELKNCPFCGREAKITRLTGMWIVGCDYDFLCYGNINHVTLLHITQEQAVEAWNRRASDESDN